MMEWLLPSEYERARGLVAGLEHHLAVRALLEGVGTAQVWVDERKHPRAVLIAHGARFYLAGETTAEGWGQAVQRYLVERALPDVRAAGGTVALLYDAPAWEPLHALWPPELRPHRAERQYYAWQGQPQQGPLSSLPEGFALREVGRALLEDTRLARLELLREEMCSERDSVEDFLAHSFGVSLVAENDLVGWCLSEYNCGDRCEVGIATLPPYQRRGLATWLATAFIAHAAAQGIRHIGWHCWARNTASGATARKAGLERVADYPVCYVPLVEKS
jgi:RimJ/RimL family protein N-acetyltransferase